ISPPTLPVMPVIAYMIFLRTVVVRGWLSPAGVEVASEFTVEADGQSRPEALASASSPGA
ncbi:MAG TPA: hypothetical protein VHY56_13890, partial [Candidatus Binataceae bacterium]|nr:hypothetical protein [Candidatus Binataceae bacterium]